MTPPITATGATTPFPSSTFAAAGTTTAGAPSPAADASGTSAGGAAATRGNDTLGKDAFLQLLVAQLRYQDPTKPVDSSQFMAQTAQFTSVEKLEQLVAASHAQQRLSAASLTGQEVGWLDAEGISHTGVVTSVRLLGSSEPTIVVGDAEVPLSAVVEFRRPAAATDTAAASLAGGTSSTTLPGAAPTTTGA